MTDFFADLRRDLLDAAERDARTGRWAVIRRLRVPVRPVFAMASVAAVGAVVLSLAATLSSVEEADIAPRASDARSAAADSVCDAPEEIPDDVRDSFGVLRRPRQEGDALPGNVSLPGDEIYTRDSRRVADLQDGSAFLVPVHGCGASRPQPGRDIVDGGVCTVLFLDGVPQPQSFCERTKETMLGRVRFVERARGAGHYVVKAVPDHVEVVRFSDGRTTGSADVRDNVVVAATGPLAWKEVVVRFRLAGKSDYEEAATNIVMAGPPDDPAGSPSANRKKALADLDACGTTEAPYTRPVSGAVPEELRSILGVLRRPATDADRYDGATISGPQVIRFYENGSRLARTVDGVRYYVIAAEIVGREDIDLRRGGVCRPPTGPGVPGACLLALDEHEKGGAIVVCLTRAEIESPDGFLDRTKKLSSDAAVAGIAPDEASAAVFDVEGSAHALPVEQNVYAGSFRATPKQLYRARHTLRR